MKVLSLLSTAALTTCLTTSGFCEEENPERMDFRESPTETMITHDTRIIQTDSLGNSTLMESNSQYRQRAMSQILVGLERAKCFSNGTLLAFNLGWEGQYWWNQYEMRFLTDFQPTGDLTFTDLDAGVRFDF